MTWAALEEEQGDPVRAEEIRNLYFQQVSSSCLWSNTFVCKFVHMLHCFVIRTRLLSVSIQ